jgi:hypothetical protein
MFSNTLVSYKTVNNGTAGLIITLAYKRNANFFIKIIL